jgi:hypothetical protein
MVAERQAPALVYEPNLVYNDQAPFYNNHVYININKDIEGKDKARRQSVKEKCV